MVKPGGTGRPRLAISARLAPLPPKRSRISALPSARPSPKVNTHLPAFAASPAGLAGTTLPAGFGAAFTGPFLSALRAVAGTTGFARAGAGGLDFTAVFLDLAAALAMACNNPREGRKLRALHHFERFGASREFPMGTLLVQPSERTEADQADADQVDRENQVEQPRHDQDQHAGDQGDDR